MILPPSNSHSLSCADFVFVTLEWALYLRESNNLTLQIFEECTINF